MTTNDSNSIRVLIADDDEQILQAYRMAFCDNDATDLIETLGSLEAELFESHADGDDAPRFDVVACSQGCDAVSLVARAAREGRPFDVVILDVRMPPGIDGVEAGSQIRRLDPGVEIVFVTGFSDIPIHELALRVPPPVKLHYFNKPLSFMQLAESVAGMVRAG
ncbi:MAG: response regulator [Woeseia sp.]